MTFETAYEALSEWQTLFGAVLALVAALWTVLEMRKQTRGNDTRHLNELLRKKMAARAQMPDALSEMSEYVRKSCEYLFSGAAKPAAPLGATSTLKAVIEHVDTKEAEKTFELICWYQVQHARLMGSTTTATIHNAAPSPSLAESLAGSPQQSEPSLHPTNLVGDQNRRPVTPQWGK